MALRRLLPLCLCLAAACSTTPPAADTGTRAWEKAEPLCGVILPSGDAKAAALAGSTLSRHLNYFYGVELPVEQTVGRLGMYVVAGTPANNPVLADLVRRGAKLTSEDLGDEGFQILTFREGARRFIIIHGNTPAALKFGCQELVFYRMPATVSGGEVEWPIDLVMKPAFAYRGIYILPCWAAYDAMWSWERVLRFNSDLTINRNWFWLDGFPVAGHTGEYVRTPLAEEKNVQKLIDLTDAEQMKFLIGGGWMNWHHAKAVGDNLDKAKHYYLDYLGAFRNFHGFYFEPTGEGRETDRWKAEAEALQRLYAMILERKPGFEIAMAIGKFNNTEYLDMMAKTAPERLWWWWCWGDPIADGAVNRYKKVLRWHLSQPMAHFHGSMNPPAPHEKVLGGVATSYDPGQGFGNPWNGWAAMGVQHPRNFHPHIVPYFANQYFFRERCWDVEMTEKEFAARLHRRLFDADAPADAGELYWKLSELAFAASQKKKPAPADLAPIEELVKKLEGMKLTARTQDTLRWMNQALANLATLSKQ